MTSHCDHSVVLLCDGYIQCRDCEHIEKTGPANFVKHEMSEAEQRAILGDELYEEMRKPVRGYLTVTKIG